MGERQREKRRRERGKGKREREKVTIQQKNYVIKGKKTKLSLFKLQTEKFSHKQIKLQNRKDDFNSCSGTIEVLILSYVNKINKDIVFYPVPVWVRGINNKTYIFY